MCDMILLVINMECLKNPECKECGGEIENGVCMYCGEKDFTIEMINKLIKPYVNINDYYMSKIRAKIAKGEYLDKQEDKVFSLLLGNNLIKDEALDDGLIVINAVQGKKLTSYDTFRLLVMRSMERSMREINNGRIKPYKPHARIKKIEGANGSTFEWVGVEFDELLIKQLYEGYTYPLITYFHEFVHVMQNIEIKLGNRINSTLIIMLKENLIRKYEVAMKGTDNYYKKNYYNISFEVNAHQFGINHTKTFLKNWGLKVDEKWFNRIMRLWPEPNNSLDRIITGKDGVVTHKTVDEIFDYVIDKNPKFLEEYPQLNFEYVNDNGVIRKRTKDELESMLVNYASDNELSSYLHWLIRTMQEDEKKVKY